MGMTGSSLPPAIGIAVVARRLLGLCSGILLAACGGGGVDADAPAMAAPSAVVVAASDTASGGADVSNTAAVDGTGSAGGDEPGDAGSVPVTPSTPSEPRTGSEPEPEPRSDQQPEPQTPAETPVHVPDPLVEVPAADRPVETPLTLESGEFLDPIGDGQTAVLQVPPVLASSLAVDAGFDVDPGRLTVQYEGGDETERLARVVADPEDAGNHMLEFLLRAANVRSADEVPSKGRIQLNAYATESVRAKEVRLRVRMNLADGFEQLRSLDRAFHWLTLSEWWNDAGWTGQAHPFRITVDITKPAAQPGARLYFAVRAETLNVATRRWDTTVWSRVNTSVPVPTGRWVTLEYHFREGDATDGRFHMAMVSDTGSRVVLFDVQGWTHHPDNPAPDGLTHLNPVKLYTSKALIEHAAAAGHPLQVFWDDIGFRLCRQRLDPATSPCRPGG